MVRLVVLLALAMTTSAASAVAEDLAVLARARQLYNMGDFDAAIAAAAEAHGAPELADGANLISGRALLERYRAGRVPDDLQAAREHLRAIGPDRLSDRERLEYIVGLGEALYFDKAPGAAAAIFDSVLRADTSPPDGRDRVLDWWASAVDEDARPRSEFERQALYRDIRTRMSDELGRRPQSSTANYWVAAAARGEGDLQAAWAAAEAAWVRAPLTADRGMALRDDIDRLVQRALIPERARAIGQPPEHLLQEWDAFKAKWSR
jgi:hypothetical protein